MTESLLGLARAGHQPAQRRKSDPAGAIAANPLAVPFPATVDDAGELAAGLRGRFIRRFGLP